MIATIISKLKTKQVTIQQTLKSVHIEDTKSAQEVLLQEIKDDEYEQGFAFDSQKELPCEYISTEEMLFLPNKANEFYTKLEVSVFWSFE